MSATSHFVVTGDEGGDGHGDRDNHADDAEQIATAGGFVGAEPAESENKQHRGGEVSYGNQT